ncbi:hypothetical protein M409DRAFT_54018 [Zasmidium cellare ATCC 36951]|uniref:Uncharacterized protein n=1 Tax=Zasmidium cellare ATCC 36951 TaxID=1080233 RepID=A0A6A6CJK8_ZASCE|nr:uncharacterized protein M409DRAFT_54018 [Zasmidium cellare ATCC 36951]KAF2167417.1 hypothetical protein M409DRAFT_54018 [Zasmidium cellare ATCC 36951]
MTLQRPMASFLSAGQVRWLETSAGWNEQPSSRKVAFRVEHSGLRDASATFMRIEDVAAAEAYNLVLLTTGGLVQAVMNQAAGFGSTMLLSATTCEGRQGRLKVTSFATRLDIFPRGSYRQYGTVKRSSTTVRFENPRNA